MAVLQLCQRPRNCHASQLCTLCCQPGPDQVGEGEVHVVSTHQDVFTDGHAPEGQFPGLFAHLDQAEVGGASPDVAHQDGLVHSNLFAPGVPVGFNPGVEGRLGFFKECDVFQTRGMGRLHRQFPCHGVEGGRDREEDVLAVKARLVVSGCDFMVPRLGKMPEKKRRCFHRGHAPGIGGAVPGEDRLGAVHPGMAQPGLGGRDEAVRDLGAALSCKSAHGKVHVRIPGEGQAARRDVVGTGEKDEGRQQGECPDLEGTHHLWDRKDRQGGVFVVFITSDFRIGDHAVGCAQVDSNNVFRFT